MKLEKRKPSGREKDQASMKLLDKLREQLHSSNSSTARRAAFNLSWMQEDGLDILQEALFGDTGRRTKGAATYGLRKMRGRMRKIALEVLSEGLKRKPSSKSARQRKSRPPRFDVREVTAKSPPKKRRVKVRGPGNRFSR
jgi:hypothetical protein